ncbi:hypothetical protein [Methylotenera sp. N17]|uniref:hypothetical protein n=1 Tax=Methylotenera sp. N17 TaxID=1502761 RepID=UPI00068C8508|nr:hypothetical protein [Methylotenera sp. N17]
MYTLFKAFFLNWYQRSTLLSDAQLAEWLSTSEILEQDHFGIKVVRLTNGDILKIFRVKRTFSSANFFSYARSFCRNEKRLHQLAIPTIQVKQLFHLSSDHKSAVLYAPLEGVTVRELFTRHELTTEHAQKLGAFMAGLHDLGIYFRGLHSGNIVLTPAGQFGLIDISEMTIFPWRLERRRRKRNFARYWRNAAEAENFGLSNIKVLISAYCAASQRVHMQEADVARYLFRQ